MATSRGTKPGRWAAGFLQMRKEPRRDPTQSNFMASFRPKQRAHTEHVLSLVGCPLKASLLMPPYLTPRPRRNSPEVGLLKPSTKPSKGHLANPVQTLMVWSLGLQQRGRPGLARQQLTKLVQTFGPLRTTHTPETSGGRNLSNTLLSPTEALEICLQREASPAQASWHRPSRCPRDWRRGKRYRRPRKGCKMQGQADSAPQSVPGLLLNLPNPPCTVHAPISESRLRRLERALPFWRQLFFC